MNLKAFASALFPKASHFSKSVTPRCTSFEDTSLCSQAFGLHDLDSTQSKHTPHPALPDWKLTCVLFPGGT